MLPEDQRRGPFGPDVSWPTGYSDLEYREGDYRYSAPADRARAAQPPAAQGQHPYAASRRPATATTATATPVTRAPRRRTPVTRSLVTRPPRRQDRPGRQGCLGRRAAGNGYGQPAYAAPAPQDYQGPDAYQADSRWRAWDYDQPLRYDGEGQSHPGRDSHGHRQTNTAAPTVTGRVRITPPAYDPAAYNGSDYSMPGINGPGYDLSGIIGTSDFEAVGYDEPSYGRLSYDDPRYDDGPRRRLSWPVRDGPVAVRASTRRGWT